MATIKFRLDRIVPIDIAPGAGYRSPEQDELASIAQDLDGAPEDEARAIVVPAGTQAIGYVMACLRKQWQVADQVDRMLRQPMARASMDRAVTDAEGRLPMSGWGGPADLVTAKGAERAKVIRSFQTDSLAAAIEKLRPKLDETADDAVDALVGFSEAIDRASAEADTPASLAADVELLDLHRQANLESEIESWGPDAMSKVLEQLGAAVRFERDDVLTNMIPAATRVATKWLATPLGKLTRNVASHYAGSIYTSTDQDTAHTRAQKVLKVIADYKASKRPQSIAVAKNCYSRLRPVFQTILGAQPPGLTNCYYVDGDLSHKGPEWEVDPTWPTRFAPPSPTPLPGWSRIMIKTDGRVPIRAPNDDAPPDDASPPRARAEAKNLVGGHDDSDRREGLLREMRGGR
jgi:hypothetical protein